MAKNLVLARAQNAVLAHDWVTAARLYKELLRGNESNVEYLKALGSIYVKAGEDEKAIPYYQQIITFYPHYVEAMNSLGAIYRRLKRYEESIEILQKALDEGRDTTSVNYNLGFTFKEMGNYKDAIDAFESVIADNPDDVLAYNHLASIYYTQKNYEKSIATFKKGLQVDPNHPILNYNLAHCYEEAKNIPDAIRCYETTLKTRPAWIDAIRDFSELLIKCQNNKEAQELVEKSIRLHPNDGDLMCILGRIFLNQFDYDKAAKTFNQADKAKPNDIEILTGFSKALEKGDNIPEALDKAIKAAELSPEDKNVKKQYAHVLLSAQRYNQALEEVQALDAQTEGKDPQVLDLYGQYFICRGDEEGAKRYYDKIQELNRNYKNHILEASERYSQIGDLNNAKKYATEYVEKRPQSAEGYNRLGAIAMAKGDMESAREEFEKGKRLCVPNVFADKGLEKVNYELSKNPVYQKNENISALSDENKTDDQNEAENQEDENLNQNQLENDNPDEFDYTQMGDNIPMGEALVEKEGDFWDEFDDEDIPEEQKLADEESLEDEEEEDKPTPIISINSDGNSGSGTGADRSGDGSGTDTGTDSQNPDDLFDDLKKTAEEEPFDTSLFDAEEDETPKDLESSLLEDSDSDDDSDFSDLGETSENQNNGENAGSNSENAGDGNQRFEPKMPEGLSDENFGEDQNIPKENAFENEPLDFGRDTQSEQRPEKQPGIQSGSQAEKAERGLGEQLGQTETGNDFDSLYFDQGEESQMPSYQNQSQNKEPYQNFGEYPPVQKPYNPGLDSQMQAAAMNYAGNAMESAFMAQRMAQELSDQQRKFEKKLTQKSEKMIHDEVDRAVEEKIQQTMDQQMEKIMSAGDEVKQQSSEDQVQNINEGSYIEEVEKSDSSEKSENPDYDKILNEIEQTLMDWQTAKDNAKKIELFKRLKELSEFIPAYKTDTYLSGRIRMVLEYIIAKLSGRPGLLMIAQSLLESGALGQEYKERAEEELSGDISNEMLKKVISYMKELALQLEDKSLSNALCTSADNILERIELEDAKSQIF